MEKLEVFKADDGHYRWRFVDAKGRPLSVRPGRIRIAGMTGRKRQRVEAALDRALAEFAEANGAQTAKA